MAQWKMHRTQRDRILTVDLNVDSKGGLSGTMTYDPLDVPNFPSSYAVTGSWAASGSLPGRNYSAFSFAGRSADPDPNFIAVTGIMTGAGASPLSIDLYLVWTSSESGAPEDFGGFASRLVPYS
jgi:hypothetical protein